MKQSVVSRGFASDPAGRVHGVPHSPKCIGAALNSVPRTTTSFLFWKLACLQTINISDTVACVFLPTSSFFVSPIRHSRVFIWMLPTRTYVDMNSDGTWTFRDIVRSANQCETNMAIDDWLIDWIESVQVSDANVHDVEMHNVGRWKIQGVQRRHNCQAWCKSRSFPYLVVLCMITLILSLILLPGLGT